MKQGKKVIVPGDGTSLWTLTWNEDFAWAFLGLMGNIHAVGETYQITSDESLTWNQIYHTAAAAMGVEARLVHIPSDVLGAKNPGLEGRLVGTRPTACLCTRENQRGVPDFKACTRFGRGRPRGAGVH
jgi:nucleoside-diphosphate-sugar epimerase